MVLVVELMCAGGFRTSVSLSQPTRRKAWRPTSWNITVGMVDLQQMLIPFPSLQFYRFLNIKVALIGLEVWTERDQCTVTSDANATLWAFLQWKKALRARKKHDNAQLLT